MAEILPLTGLPLFAPGDDLAGALWAAAGRLEEGDVVAVTHKVVSKVEGRLVRLIEVEPSPRAWALAAETGKDARLVELILRESRRVVRLRPGLIIVEDRRGLICANAGIDRSNIEQAGPDEAVCLLPEDPDASARRLRDRLHSLSGRRLGVLIVDSHGRPFRLGVAGIAVGVAGFQPLEDLRGEADLFGFRLVHTELATADQLAAAASAVMGQRDEGMPAVVLRGFPVRWGEGSARSLLRPPELDLFR